MTSSQAIQLSTSLYPVIVISGNRYLMVKDDSGLAAGESGRVLCIINTVCCKISLQSYYINARNCPLLLLHHSVSIILLPRGIRYLFIKVYTFLLFFCSQEVKIVPKQFVFSILGTFEALYRRCLDSFVNWKYKLAQLTLPH